MSAPFKDATNDAVQFLTKHGDLTRAAAYDAIRLLTGNGFVVTQTDMLPSATDLSQAAVAAALEAAAVIAETHHVYQAHVCAARIRALITPAQHDALAAHGAAEVAKARAEWVGSHCKELTAADRAHIIAHLSYELEPVGKPPTWNQLAMEVVRLSNTTAQIGAKP